VAPSIDVQQLRAAWPHALLYRAELASTNSAALDWCRSSAELPVLVVAERQLAGRGQADRSWWSSSGSLTLSVAISADFLGIPRSGVSLAAANAVAEAIEAEATGRSAEIKWPNDVLLEGRKVAGILVEAIAAPRSAIVIGIGVNLNNEPDSVPEELAQQIAITAEWAGRAISPTDFLTRLANALMSFCSDLSMAKVLSDFRARCCLRGRQVQVTSAARSDVGKCLGVDDEGRLLIQTADGATMAFSSAHVRLADDSAPPPM
jgi:BirA family biotin operon repressor/biotin-[acetyl-CoA-carboxylase] ligase